MSRRKWWITGANSQSSGSYLPLRRAAVARRIKTITRYRALLDLNRLDLIIGGKRSESPRSRIILKHVAGVVRAPRGVKAYEPVM